MSANKSLNCYSHHAPKLDWFVSTSISRTLLIKIIHWVHKCIVSSNVSFEMPNCLMKMDTATSLKSLAILDWIICQAGRYAY